MGRPSTCTCLGEQTSPSASGRYVVASFFNAGADSFLELGRSSKHEAQLVGFVYVPMYIYIRIQTYTHPHIYIYICIHAHFLCKCVCMYAHESYFTPRLFCKAVYNKFPIVEHTLPDPSLHHPSFAWQISGFPCEWLRLTMG